MPLRAFADGKPVVSVSIPFSEWDRLKIAVRAGSVRITLPCCQGRGFLRRSVRRLQHFVHAPGSACDRRHFDSGGYLEIVSVIHQAAEETGFPFEIETTVGGMPVPALLKIPGKNGRLAVIGFEKKYTASQIRSTQERLAAYGIRGCWLVTGSAYDGLVFESSSLRKEPIFRIEKTATGWRTCLRGGMPLRDFLAHLFRGHFQYRDHAVSHRSEEIAILLYRISCPRCGEPSAVYSLSGNHLSQCDLNLGPADRDRFRIEAIAAARHFAAESNIPLGHVVALNKSDPPSGFVDCPVCRKSIPGSLLPSTSLRAPAAIRPVRIVWKSPLRFDFPHWCFSVSRRFCS